IKLSPRFYNFKNRDKLKSKLNLRDIFFLSLARVILRGDIFTFGSPVLPDWLRHPRLAVRQYSFATASLLPDKSGFVNNPG
ncbi:MAG: hypothetical protein JXQ83_09675, partial [Candidatus Glassbacteria bacterium]|nr:hypothetical protein [Candidatus Glassbacteria bacterium]